MKLPLIFKLPAAGAKEMPLEVFNTEVNSGWHTHRFLNDLTFLGRMI